MAGPSELKGGILRSLYDFHKTAPQGSVRARHLLELLGADDEEGFFSALQSLHDEEYIEGTFLPYERQGFFESVRITPRGVDLVDNPGEFQRLFPPSREHAALDAFTRDFLDEVKKADIPEKDKESVTAWYRESMSLPALKAVLSRALLRFRKPG
jgi:hypothetical protein